MSRKAVTAPSAVLVAACLLAAALLLPALPARAGENDAAAPPPVVRCALGEPADDGSRWLAVAAVDGDGYLVPGEEGEVTVELRGGATFEGRVLRGLLLDGRGETSGRVRLAGGAALLLVAGAAGDDVAARVTREGTTGEWTAAPSLPEGVEPVEAPPRPVRLPAPPPGTEDDAGPVAMVRVGWDGPAVPGEPVLLRAEALDADGRVTDALDGSETWIALAGADATFTGACPAGKLVDGAGTTSAIVHLEEGRLALEVLPRSGGDLFVTLQWRAGTSLHVRHAYAEVGPRDGSATGDAPEATGDHDVPDGGVRPPAHRPWKLPFEVTDAVFDPVKPRLWVTSKEDRAVYLVNLRSGRAVRKWSFDQGPEHLAITPDGSRLFVTIPAGPHRPWGSDLGSGHVASWDLGQKLLDRYFRVDFDPLDIVATSDGHLVVSSGSGWRGYLRVLDATDGHVTDSDWHADTGAFLAPRPQEDRVYATYDNYHYDVERYDLLPGGRIDYSRAVRGDAPGRAGWITPDGSTLALSGGDLLALRDEPGDDMEWTGTFTRHGISDLAFDGPNRTVASLEKDWLRFYNLETWIPFSSQPLARASSFVGFSEGRVLVLAVEQDLTRILRFAHPAPNGADNTPPRAALSMDPARPFAGDEVTFDASGSTDAEDGSDGLRYRWDLDGDGTWDTDFSGDPVLRHRFPVPDNVTVRVQVADSLGLADVASLPVEVSFRPDPGEPGPDHAPFDLPWGADTVAFDSARDHAWIASIRSRRVFLVDAERGTVIRAWSLPLVPSDLVLSADGRRLFLVATKERPDPWSTEGRSWIGSWDLETAVMDRLLPIEPYATEVAPGPPGVVVVFHPRVGAFSLDAATGRVLDGPVGPGYRGGVSARPDGSWFYVLDGAGNPALHVDVRPDGGLVERWVRRPGLVGTPWWAFPGGDRVLVPSGRVLACTGDAATDLDELGRIGDRWKIEDAAFDGPVLATVAHRHVSYHDIGTLERFSTLEIEPSRSFVGFTTSHVVIVSSGGDVFLLAHPAPGGTWEAPPEPRLEVIPPAPTSLDEILLDASGTTDPESPLEDLRFRWDIDGDGTWDTDWTGEPTYAAGRVEPGPVTFRVAVQDPCGAISIAEQAVEVTFVPDPGEPVSPHQPYRLPFVAGGAKFLPGRPFFLATHPGEKAVYLVDTRSGLAVRRWRFVHPPESLRVSPDGSRAHALLRVRSAPGRSGSGGEVRLVSWDLATMTMDRYLRVSMAVPDYVVTPDGYYVVMPGKGSDPFLRALDPETGAEVDRAELGYSWTGLALHPDGHRLYATRSYHRPCLRLFLVEPGGRLTRERDYDCPWEHPVRWPAWFTPDGTRMITAANQVFDVPENPEEAPAFRQAILPPYPPARDVAFDARNGEFFVASRGIHRFDTETLELLDLLGRNTDFLAVGKVGKQLFGLHGWWANGVTFCPHWEINHPPVADAGEDRVLECTGNLSATATLDGSGSWDPDSEGEPDEDIASWDWFEGETSLASGEVADVPFSLGEHEVTLVVTDRSDATDDDTVRVTVRDTIAPAGAITWPPAGACFGPAAVPVTVTDDVADTCDPAPSRAWLPGPGPAYADHGDHDVTLVVTDVAGNEFRDHVPFTIDLVPPVIVVRSPDPGWALGPGSVPASLAFTATDDDGAAGGVVHEWIEIEGCVAWDGDDYGDGDGLLSDEEIPLGPAELCRVVSACGFEELHDPLVTIHAVDCGGNETAASRRIPGSFTPLPGLCPP